MDTPPVTLQDLLIPAIIGLFLFIIIITIAVSQATKTIKKSTRYLTRLRVLEQIKAGERLDYVRSLYYEDEETFWSRIGNLSLEVQDKNAKEEKQKTTTA